MEKVPTDDEDRRLQVWLCLSGTSASLQVTPEPLTPLRFARLCTANHCNYTRIVHVDCLRLAVMHDGGMLWCDRGLRQPHVFGECVLNPQSCRVLCAAALVRVQEIKITGADIFVNPFQEMEQEEREKEAAAAKKVCHPAFWPASLPVCVPACLVARHACFGAYLCAPTPAGLPACPPACMPACLWALPACWDLYDTIPHYQVRNGCYMCYVLLQADAGNPEDPDNLRSSWFSNPGASATAAPVRSGVGKYIAGAALDAPLSIKSSAAGVAAAAAAEPAIKKQKLAAAKQQPMANFDAW